MAHRAEILKAVPHRHFTFSIPKILRRYFLYDRKLLSNLSRCGWESLKAFFPAASGIPEKGAVPGAVIAIQTFGDFLGLIRTCFLEPELSPKEFRKNWARLIQKIYEVDPLVCSRCQGSMQVIAFIENEDVPRGRACGTL